MTTKATQQDINRVSRVADDIARFPETWSVRPETYYDDAGNPGRVIRCGHWVDAYVQLRLQSRTLEVWVKDTSTGTETGREFSRAEDAVMWAKDEIATRVGVHFVG